MWVQKEGEPNERTLRKNTPLSGASVSLGVEVGDVLA